MRLERLEINGFKSFSDRSELAFDRGVTAIVAKAMSPTPSHG